MSSRYPEPGSLGGYATKKVAYSPDLIADEALQFVEQHRDRPFFLYLGDHNSARQQRSEQGHWQRPGSARTTASTPTAPGRTPTRDTPR